MPGQEFNAGNWKEMVEGHGKVFKIRIISGNKDAIYGTQHKWLNVAVNY